MPCRAGAGWMVCYPMPALRQSPCLARQSQYHWLPPGSAAGSCLQCCDACTIVFCIMSCHGPLQWHGMAWHGPILWLAGRQLQQNGASTMAVASQLRLATLLGRC